MANSKKLDSSKLLGPKIDIIKETPYNNIETAIKKIHETKPVEEKTTRSTLDIPVSLHKKIKQQMLNNDIKTLKDYFLDLAKKDLGLQ